MLNFQDIKSPEYTQLEVLKIIQQNEICPLKNSGIKVVPPVGSGTSKVFLVGEAPGAKEDELGQPFVGAAGKFLNNQLLPTLNLDREKIYLTNIVKCRPPNNRDPLEVEKEAWIPALLAEIAFIQPAVIACLGRHAMNFFLPDKKISQIHGKPIKVNIFKNFSCFILPLYHPAAALYNPNLSKTLIQDFQVIKTIPGVKL